MRFGHGNVITAAIVLVAFATLTLLELRFPLRTSREPKLRRIARNLALAAVSYLLLLGLQAPILVPLALWTSERGMGLLSLVQLPRAAEIAIGVILLDYTLWIWHWLNHKVPFLWRFHLVHHVDRDLDASTALRFHFGELILSIGYRCLQIVAIGADLWMLALWQAILFAAILFHHSNVRLPETFERALVWLIVTPRMHGIHHSTRREETDSNWSSILTIWDVLHRTLRLDVAQESVTIGVPAWQNPEDVRIGRLLLMPFQRQRRDWTAGG